MSVSPKMDGKTRHLRVFPPVRTWGARCAGPYARKNGEEGIAWCPALDHAEGRVCTVFKTILDTLQLGVMPGSYAEVRIPLRAAACLEADRGEERFKAERGT
jgi:hypothetical protein